MTDTTPAADVPTDATAAQPQSHKTPSRLDRIMGARPRVTKALFLTGAAVVATTVAGLVKNVHGNRDHLALAAGHVEDAAGEVVASVSSDTETV